MQRRSFLLGVAAAAGALGTGLVSSACSGDGPGTGGATEPGTTTIPRHLDRPNVLFIAIDDMNDWAGFLNPHPGTSTPNLDALAARSLVFERAYCTVPMCLPSRTSVVWGSRPYDTDIYDHSDRSLDIYREYSSEVPALTTSYQEAGYLTLGGGKITHDFKKALWDELEVTEFYADGHVRDGERWQGRYDPDWISPYDGMPIGRGERFEANMVDFGPSGVTAAEQPDGLTAAWVCDQLRRDHDRPFFLAYGTNQPHTPWRVPQEFFDIHPLEEVVVPEYRPDDLDDLSDYVRDNIIDTHGSFELIREADIWSEAVQAYQASVSFADWCVGTILDELAASPYADNTIVALWSDHGWHLGEKMHWHKFTLWERATRVPLLLHVPGAFDSGRRVLTPVSLLDLGPTLADLCGIELHAAHEGRSLIPVLDDPALGEDRPPISTWKAGNHSVRQGPYRYIRYETGDTELYDHRDDPEELNNLARSSDVQGIVAELDAYLPSRG